MTVLLPLLYGCKGKVNPVVPEPQTPETPLNTDVPDKAGHAVKGLVSCEGKPVQGAVVSDGVNVTQTNLEGKYWLKTDTRSDFVFLSIPSGYEVPLKGNIPQFYYRFDHAQKDAVQRFDFELARTGTDDYELIVFSDIHICARKTPLCTDSERFSTKVLPDVQRWIGSRPAGTKFYGLSLGDMVQDEYIAKSGFKEFLDLMAAVKFPMFYVVGNHDHLPDAPVAEDEDARSLKEYYMSYMGPTYYSFNLGKVHYVVLDNNTMVGGGTNKNRNHVTAKQLEWLTKDLSKVEKSMRLVICLHQPLLRNDATSKALKLVPLCENYQAIASACDGFEKIDIFAGHSHFAETVNWSNRFTQTTHPSVCGVWWLSRYCHDGTPASWSRYEVSGTDMKQYLMSYDHASHPEGFVHRSGVTDSDGAPAIQINVPFYGNGWKVRVTEDGNEVSQAHAVPSSDYYYETVEFPAQPESQRKYDTVKPRSTWHNLYYTPVNGGAKIEIEVTDASGEKIELYDL